MHGMYQIAVESTPQQLKEVNLMQLHVIQWLNTQAQQNFLNLPVGNICCHHPVDQPYCSVPLNMNYFVGTPNGGSPQKLYPGATMKPIYNHAHSGNHQPYSLGQLPNVAYVGYQAPYPPAYVCGQMPPAYYGYPPPNMVVVPQVVQLPCHGPPSVRFVAPASMPVKCPEQHILHEDHNPLAMRKHVFVNGMLYNTELMEESMERLFMRNLPVEVEHNEDDAYDPMDDDMPSIHGIRFFNPKYEPEDSIPLQGNDDLNESENWKNVLSNGSHGFENAFQLFPLNHLASSTDYGQTENLTISNMGAEQNLTEDARTTAQSLTTVIRPSSVPKRRQRRNRSRELTQSFGIFAPMKRNCHTVKENMMAAMKPSNKAWKDIEPDELNNRL